MNNTKKDYYGLPASSSSSSSFPHSLQRRQNLAKHGKRLKENGKYSIVHWIHFLSSSSTTFLMHICRGKWGIILRKIPDSTQQALIEWGHGSRMNSNPKLNEIRGMRLNSIPFIHTLYASQRQRKFTVWIQMKIFGKFFNYLLDTNFK